MKRNLLLTVLLVFTLVALSNMDLLGQKWTGGGDGTSWEDPNNWDSGEVPVENALLKFAKDAVVTGTAPNNPAQIKVQKNINVVLDLDLTFGDGEIAEHALTVASGSTLTLGSEGNTRSFTINIAPNKQGIAAFGANENLTVNILEGTTVHAVQTQFGINLVNATSVLNNYGQIIAEAGVTVALKTGGTYNNYGVVDATNVGNNGIITAPGGTFINHESGVINIQAGIDDCIELQDGSTFMNYGSLNVTKGPEAGWGNSAIVVAGKTVATTFINNSEQPLNISGSSDTSRIFHIDTLGVFENHSIVNVSAVNVDSSVLVQGALHNMPGAYLNVLSGFVDVGETGSFTNDWVLTMNDSESNLNILGTAINNGFYNYASGASFAVGSGSIVDNGLPFVSNIDANGECTVDLANISLEWFEGENSVGTSDETGALTFAEASLHDNPTTLTTSIEGVEVSVENYCPEAWIDPSNIFDIDRHGAELRVYPTIVENDVITFELSALVDKSYRLQIVNSSGKLIFSGEFSGNQKHNINVSELDRGLYFIRLKEHSLNGRFIIAR